MRFALINESTITDSAFGGQLDPTTLSRMADALTIYLDRDVSPEWGGNYNVRALADKTKIERGEVACVFMNSLPNAPEDVAYHDRDGKAVPFILLARSQCNSLLTGPDSVASATSHEVAEAAADPACNLWVDMGNGGEERALELCDPVQNWGYDIGGVAVSDFVRRAFFAPGADGPYNHVATIGVNALTAPFATAIGGYQLTRKGAGAETQIFGLVAPHRAARKRHWASRTYQRGARV